MLRFYNNLTEQQKTIVTLVLLMLALFVNLGLQPLYLEEPRRALVAFEMMLRNNFLVPTEFGVPYFNKPPFWNWIVILGLKMFPVNVEMAGRLFSVLFFLLSGYVLYKVGKIYVNKAFAVIASISYLISVDILFYFSLLGEIDLFYSSITFISFVLLFHLYNQKKFFVAFTVFYGLNAIGLLTKGLPSIPFTGITILVLFILNKDLKRLYSVSNIAGMLLFLILTVGYFYFYSLQGNVEGYIERLFTESASRTQSDKINLYELVLHILEFPLETIKNILPAGLLVPFAFLKGNRKQLKANKLVLFFFWTLITNIFIYWISAGSKQRYIYMLYPLLIGVVIYFYQLNKDRLKIYNKVTYIISIVIIVALIAGSISIPFLPMLKTFSYTGMISVVFTLLFLFLLVIILKQKKFDLWPLIWSILLLRIAFNFTVLPYRAVFESPAIMKNHAHEIAQITGDEKVNLTNVGDVVCPRTLVFYIEKEKNQIVYKNNFPEKGAFCIADTSLFPNVDYEIFYKFEENKDETYHLIKFY